MVVKKMGTYIDVSVNSQFSPSFYFQVMAGSRAAGQDLVDARLPLVFFPEKGKVGARRCEHL